MGYLYAPKCMKQAYRMILFWSKQEYDAKNVKDKRGLNSAIIQMWQERPQKLLGGNKTINFQSQKTDKYRTSKLSAPKK